MKKSRCTRAGIIPIMALLIVGFILTINLGSLAGLNEMKSAAPKNNPDFDLIVTNPIDLQKLKSYGLPIIIDFGSDSCTACKDMAPVLKELNETLRGKAIIKFVDVLKYSSLYKGFPIRLIPTQVFIGSDGKPFVPADPVAYMMSYYSDRVSGEHLFTRHEGGMTKSQLLSVLKEMGVNP